MTETNAERLERLENEWRIKSANYDWMLEQARLADDYLAIVGSQRDSLTRLTSENGRFREALKYYAEKDHYQDNVIAEWGPMTEVLRDEGKTARQALEDSP